MLFRAVLASSSRTSSGEPIFSTPLFFNALQRQKISTLWRRVAKAWRFTAKAWSVAQVKDSRNWSKVERHRRQFGGISSLIYYNVPPAACRFGENGVFLRANSYSGEAVRLCSKTMFSTLGPNSPLGGSAMKFGRLGKHWSSQRT